MTPEFAREVGLVGEAAHISDLGEAHARGREKAARSAAACRAKQVAKAGPFRGQRTLQAACRHADLGSNGRD